MKLYLDISKGLVLCIIVRQLLVRDHGVKCYHLINPSSTGLVAKVYMNATSDDEFQSNFIFVVSVVMIISSIVMMTGV